MKTITLTEEQESILKHILNEVWLGYKVPLNTDTECEAVQAIRKQLGQ